MLRVRDCLRWSLSPSVMLVVLACGLGLAPVGAATPDLQDWPHWRGPNQNGISPAVGLPDQWSVDGENLLWRREELATRSTPIVMNGRLYTICRAFPETTREGEKVVCLNAESGELVWEAINNVYLTDSPAERVGWSSVIGDPATGDVYSLGLGCHFQCLDGASGRVLWSHSMSEEYGMLSTYGGRTNFPVLFEDLVIVSGVMTGWGEYAVPAHRFVAFDKRTGTPVWIASTRLRPEDTTYSTPVITSFNGQAAMVFGAADGAVYALQPRTGKVIWKYDASTRGINCTPLVADGIVYCGHSEQNAADTSVLGAVFAFDGRTQGEIKEDQLLWKVSARTIGRSQPLLWEGRLYVVEDGGTLYVMDSKTGRDIGRRHKVGRIMFGSPVAAAGKIYIGEATGRWQVLSPTDQGVRVVSQVRLNDEEILGSPVIAHNRIYLPTGGALYCLGNKNPSTVTANAAARAAEPVSLVQETPVNGQDPVAQIQITPVEMLLAPGESVPLTVRAFNARGQFLRNMTATFDVRGAGKMDANGHYTAAADNQPYTATITARTGELSAVARVRAVPPLPWTFDFSNKQVPSTWIGASYRHQPKEIDGEHALVKISTIPKGTRSQAWMGPVNLHDYTIQADFRATPRDEKIPDMGLINQRYSLIMLGTQKLQIGSWRSRLELRFAKSQEFSWKPGTWYTVKFQAENQPGQVILRGKVWPRNESEPSEWTIEAADATPNVAGSPGMFGNSSDTEFLIDNVTVVSNSR